MTDVGCERLLNEDWYSCFEKRARYGAMSHRRDDDRHCVDHIAAHQLAVIGDPTRAAFGRDFLPLFGPTVSNCYQFDFGQLTENPRVMSSESTDTDNR